MMAALETLRPTHIDLYLLRAAVEEPIIKSFGSIPSPTGLFSSGMQAPSPEKPVAYMR